MITLLKGDRRSGKTHRAIEMAKARGVPWYYVVRHGSVASARKTWPDVDVRSIRTPGLAKRGVSLFVIDDAHRMQPGKLAQFVLPGSEVLLISIRVMPPWLERLAECEGVTVVDTKPAPNPLIQDEDRRRMQDVLAIIDPKSRERVEALERERKWT